MNNPPLHLVLAALLTLGIAGCSLCTPHDAGTRTDTGSNYIPKCSGRFVLRSSAVTNGGALPVEFTGDGSSSTLPLEWYGAPPATKTYAVIMRHLAPGGVTKWYWTLYNIPGNIHSLPKDVQGIGTPGNNSVNHRVGYAPPHSKGPGPKTYILTVYALSAPIQISLPPSAVSRDVLLTAMKDFVLDSAELKFTYDRTAFIERDRGDRPLDRTNDNSPNL